MGVTGDQWIDNTAGGFQNIIGMGRCPTFTRMMGTLAVEGYDLVLDDMFELGLRSLLDGLAIRFGPDA